MNDLLCACGWVMELEEVPSPYDDSDYEYVCHNPNCINYCGD